jgi:hypothetical protein
MITHPAMSAPIVDQHRAELHRQAHEARQAARATSRRRPRVTHAVSRPLVQLSRAVSVYSE